MATTVAKNNYVIIDANNKVISVFKGEELPEYNENMINVIDVTTVVPKPQLTWTYDSSTNSFTAPVVVEPEDVVENTTPTPVELLKEELRVQVNEVEYMGTTFQTGGYSIHIIIAYLSLISIDGSLPENFFWLDKFNNKVPMTEDQFKTFASLCITNYWINFSNYVEERNAL